MQFIVTYIKNQQRRYSCDSSVIRQPYFLIINGVVLSDNIMGLYWMPHKMEIQV